MTEFARLRPHQLQDGIAAKTPVVLPIGVMEYHGQHLPAGVNLLAVTEVLERFGFAGPSTFSVDVFDDEEDPDDVPTVN